MKLPNWFKILWWVLLFFVITFFLYQRYPELVLGHETPADIFVFFIWIAIALVPLFQEISFFGITLKQEIKKLGSEIASLRSEVQNSVRVQTQINPQFNVLAPPPDSALPKLAEQIREATQSVSRAVPEPDLEAQVEENTMFLFQARYSIERELRRLWRNRWGEPERPFPISHITGRLLESQVLSPALASLIPEVYSVCSAAIHGEPPSLAQVRFVRDVVPDLLNALRAIR